MKYCLINSNNIVADVITQDPKTIFHIDIADIFVVCPDNVEKGMCYDGEKYIQIIT